MSPVTLFVLQIAGPGFVLMGLAMLLNSKRMKKLYVDIFDNDGLCFLFGMVLFVLGMAMVLKHNVWGNFNEVVVSIIGWGSIVKGVMFLLFPQVGKSITKSVVNAVFPVAGVLIGLLGIYLSYVAYYM